MSRPPLVKLFLIGVCFLTFGVYSYFLALSLNSEVPAVAKARWVEVAVPDLNFRTEPQANAKVMRKLGMGERLRLIKEQENWLLVEDDKGVNGWVHRLYVVYSPPGLR